MIRKFAQQDLKDVLNLCEELKERTSYRMIKTDFPSVVRVLTKAAVMRDGFLRVAEHDGRLTGLIVGVAETLWWQDERYGARRASDLLFYSKRMGDGVQMLKAMREWAFNVPRVVRVECAISSGITPDRAQRMYERAGFTREGSLFVANHPKYEAALSGKQVAA